MAFSNKDIRAKFIRKVYAILFTQLMITVGFIGVFIFVPAIRDFYCDSVNYDEQGFGHCLKASSNGFIVYVASFVLFFVTYLAITCCKSLRRKSPENLVTLAIFTLSLSIFAASVAIYHDVYWVLMAIGMTAALCLGLTLFSFQAGGPCSAYTS